MRTSRYSVKAPDIEEKLQAMMDYVSSEDGKKMDKSLAYSIAGLILEGKKLSEITNYLEITYDTLYCYMDPTYREKKKEYLKGYLQEYYKRPEIKEKIKNNQRTYRQKPEAKEKKKTYRRVYRQKPEVMEKQREYQKYCPIAYLWREEDISDDSNFSRFLTYEDLLRRKKKIGLKGQLKGPLQDWVLAGIIEESEDLGVKRYAINFSSPYFSCLEE